MGASNIQSHRRHTVAILLAFTALTKPAWAQSVLPAGGHVVAGSATIGAPAGNMLTINQTSNRAVANWNSFSVGAPNTINIVQPGSSAALLNRVTGNTPSTIAGQINANGQVYLVNPNGIAITPNGSVQTGGGFIASTLAITNSNFMSGNLSFTGNGASAPVSNAGKITAGFGGSVALIGGTASNSGVISVPLGKVALGSGEQATLDLNGDGFMQVAVPTGTTTAKGQALVSNSGRVDAAGGTVEMTAATVANAIRNAVNMSGVVTANSVSGHDGAIHLSGGPGGVVNVSGTLDASGTGPGMVGGAVKLTGNSVDLAPAAAITATGDSGGGTIEVGGGPHGADPDLADAQNVTVEAGATIDASATNTGNGGTVSVWSENTTVFNGTILATGGPTGGNGGWVETSGHDNLGVGPTAQVSTLAPSGKTGTWLLDPATIEVESTGSGTLAQASATVLTGDVIIAAATINAAASNVVLNGSTSVTFETAVNMVNAGVSLTVQGGTITLNTGASVTLTNGNFIVQGFDGGSGPGTSAASFTQNTGANIDTGGGAISINTMGAINLKANLTATGNIVTLISTNNGITQPATLIGITADTLTGSASFATLFGEHNDVVILGNFPTTSSTSDFAFSDAGLPSGGTLTVSGAVSSGHNAEIENASIVSLTPGGSVAAGNTALLVDGAITVGPGSSITGPTVTLNATSSGITLDGAVGSAGGTVALISNGAIAQRIGSVTTAGTLTTTSTTGQTLIGANTVGSFNATNATSGDITLINTAAPLTVTGITQTGGNVFINNSGAIITTGAVTASGNTVTLNSSGTISQTGGIITAATLTGSSAGGATLTQANMISDLGNFTDFGSGSVGISLTNAQSLSINGTVSSATGPITLTTTGAGSNLILGASVAASSGTVTLISAGTISQTAGTITAATLTGSSTGGATLTQANLIADLGPFTDTGSGSAGISLTDAQSLSINGTVTTTGPVILTTTAGTGGITIASGSSLTAGTNQNLTLDAVGPIAIDSGATLSGFVVDLSATGAITETGTITAIILKSSNGVSGNVSLLGNNAIGTVDAFSVTGAGNGFALADNSSINVNSAVSAAGNVFMETSNGDGVVIFNTGSVTAGNGMLVSFETPSFSIFAGGAVSAGATGTFELAPLTSTALTVGPGGYFGSTNFITAGTFRIGAVTLPGSGLTTTASSITVAAGGFSAGAANLDLETTGAIDGTGGPISAATLTGNAGSADLPNSGNAIATLGSFTAAAGFTLTNSQSLTITGPVTAPGGITLTTIGGTPNLVLSGNLTAAGNTVTFYSAGTITQSGGSIDPNSLLIASTGSVSMTGANTVDTLAASITGAGASLTFNNTSNALTIGTVGGVPGITTNNGNVNLSVVTSGGLTIGNAINAGTGSVTAASVGNLALGAVVSGGPITLATLGNFTNTAGASALSAGGGNNWLVYSTNPASDADGGLTPAFIQYAANYPVGTSGTPASPDASGNGLLYSVAPVVTINSVTKTYDGTTTLPALSGFSISGAINGDSVSLNLTGSTGSYASANAGTAIGVTLNGASLVETHGSEQVFGYGLALANGGDIGTITPATLTAGLTGTVSKTYNATTAATLTSANYTLSGIIGSDNVSIGNTSGTYASPNAGSNIGVSVSALALTGTAAGNYTLANTTVAANIGAITPATLTAGLTGTVSKTYDGATSATLTSANYSLSGVVGSDSVSLNDPVSGTYASANVGSNIGVSVSGLALTGTAAGNYTLASTTATANIGTITPATLTAGLTGTVSKIYNGTTSATLTSANYSLSGVVGSDSVSLNDPTSGTYASTNAGSAIAVSVSGLTLTGAASGNYTLASTTASGNIGTITPAALTAGLTGTVSKTYNGTAAATLTSANYTLSGIVGSDSVSLNDPASGAYASANAGSAIGVSVSGLALTGTAAGNYTLASTKVSANIGTIAPATLTAGLTGTVSKVYDGTTTATLAAVNYTLSGVIGSDNVSIKNTSGSYASANAGSAIGVSVSGLALTGSAAGNYTLASTKVGANIGTITPRPLTITANDQLRYRGVSNPPLTYAVTSGTLVTGDTLTGTPMTLALPDSPAGSYAITQGTLAASTNYAISFVDGQLTVLTVPDVITDLSLSALEPFSTQQPLYVNTLTQLSAEEIATMLHNLVSISLIAPQ